SRYTNNASASPERPRLAGAWLGDHAPARRGRSGLVIHSIPCWRCKLVFEEAGCMVEPMMIDLRALLVEKEDCDAGTVQRVREAWAQGGTQSRSLREVTELLRKRVESAPGAAAKRWHLKLGIASFFLGHTRDAAEHLRQAEGALANFYLGKALASLQEF